MNPVELLLERLVERRRADQKLPQFSRQSLTCARRWGINALGVIEFTIVLLPLLIGQALGADKGSHGEPRGISSAARIAWPLVAGAVVVIDVWWRRREEPGSNWVVRLISPDAGGAVLWIPVWVVWAAFAVFGIFLLVAQPHCTSPYERGTPTRHVSK